MSYRIEAATKEEWAERALRAEEKLREAQEALIGAAAHLAAAISLLERVSKSARKAAPSDTMFGMMLNDYRKSLEEARETLANLDNA